jgi:hypothetical protein
VIDQRLARSIAHVVQVLHAHDVEDAVRLLELGDAHLGESDMADESLVDELPDGAELLRRRHLRVDAVQLPQVDALDAQSAQRHVQGLAQVLRPPHGGPEVGPLPGESALRGDEQAVIGVKGFRIRSSLVPGP